MKKIPCLFVREFQTDGTFTITEECGPDFPFGDGAYRVTICAGGAVVHDEMEEA